MQNFYTHDNGRWNNNSEIDDVWCHVSTGGWNARSYNYFDHSLIENNRLSYSSHYPTQNIYMNGAHWVAPKNDKADQEKANTDGLPYSRNMGDGNIVYAGFRDCFRVVIHYEIK